MGWLESSFLACFFALPAVSIVALYYPVKSGGKLKVGHISVIFMAAVLVLTLAAAFVFPQSGGAVMALDIPVPAPEFEISFVLSLDRIFWIISAAMTLLALLFLNGDSVFKHREPVLRYLYLLGFFNAFSLAILSEKIFPSLMFAEAALFLLHSFALLEGDLENKLERVSYFKRSAFIFLGLVLMIILYSTSLFGMGAIALSGLVLYVLSLIFSKHSYLSWDKNSDMWLLFLMSAFFVWRALTPQLATEMWVPVSMLFALFSAGCLVLSFLSLSRLRSFYWLGLGVMQFVLFLQFVSGEPWSPRWVLIDGSQAMTFVLMGHVLMTLDGAKKDLFFWVMRISISFLLFYVVGAIPGLVSETAKSLAAGGWHIYAPYLVLAFLASLSFIKIIVTGGGIERGGGASKALAIGSAAAAFGILLAVNFVAARLELISADAFFTFRNTEESIVGLSVFPLVLLGAVIAVLLCRNKNVMSYLRKREDKMEELLPRVDPALISLNRKFATSPANMIDKAVTRAVGASEAATAAVKNAESAFFESWFWTEMRKYVESASLLVRYLHAGTLTEYYLFALVVMIVAVLFFVVGYK